MLLHGIDVASSNFPKKNAAVPRIDYVPKGRVVVVGFGVAESL